MFLGCEVTLHFSPTSELDYAVVALIFDDGLWILFLEMCFAFDVLVIHTLILTL
jgi:hypothetical protein